MNWKKGTHGNTYGDNPIACAASLATIDLIENEYMENAATTGQYAIDALTEIMHRHPSIGDVRGKGLMIGVELKEKAGPYVQKLMEKGVIALLAGATVIRLLPPLVISKNEIDKVVSTLGEVLS